MKSTTLIIVIIILFLAIKPGIDFISLPTTNEQTCCSGQCNPIVTHQKSADQHNEDDCAGKFCNPFQVCCSCVLQSSTNPVSELLKHVISAKQLITYNSTFCKQFAVDFWHPPKIV